MTTTKMFRAITLLLAAMGILLFPGASHGGIFTIFGGHAEAIGDAGGTHHSSILEPFYYTQDSKRGWGLPTVRGGWTDTASFDEDVLFNNDRGISGFSNNGGALTIYLNAARDVTFTWMGSGNAQLLNSFWVNGVKIFEVPTNPSGAVSEYYQVPDISTVISLPVGPIQFKWITGSDLPVTVANGDDNTVLKGPSFFAGIDPYSVSTPYQRTGHSLYLGLSDLPFGGNDHDYQDLGVLLEAEDLIELPNPVPEPATLTTFLIGLAVSGGWAGVRNLRNRRRAAAGSL